MEFEVSQTSSQTSTTAAAAAAAVPAAKKPRGVASIRRKIGGTVDGSADEDPPSLIPEESWFRLQKDLLASQAYLSFEEARRTGTNEMIVVTKDLNEKCQKTYAVIPSWRLLKDEILQYKEKSTKRNYYEMFMREQRVKLYFDYELKGPFDAVECSDEEDFTDKPLADAEYAVPWYPARDGRPSRCHDTSVASVTDEELAHIALVPAYRNVRPSNNRIMFYLNRVVHRAKTSIRDFYGINIEDQWFAIQDSSGADKVSFHIVLTRGVYFRDCSVLKEFFNRVMFRKEDLQNTTRFPEFTGVDPSVYAIHRQFRLPLCTKLGEPNPEPGKRWGSRPLKMDENFSWEDQIVTYCPPAPVQVTLEDGSTEMRPTPVVDFNVKEFEARQRILSKAVSKAPTRAALDTTDTVEVRAERDLPAMLFTIPVESVDDYALWVDTGIKFKRAGGKMESWIEWTSRYCAWKFRATGEPSKRAERENPNVACERLCVGKWNGFDPTSDLHLFLAHVERVGTGKVRYASPDAPDEAQELNGAELVKMYKDASLEHIGLLHNEIAQAFMLKHPNHVYSNGNWYFFDGTRWLKDAEGMWLARNILRWQVEINMKLKELKEQFAIDEEQVEEAGAPGGGHGGHGGDRRRRGADQDTEENFGHVLTEEEKRKIAAQKLAAKLKAVKRITQDASIGNNNALRTLYFNDRFVEDLETRLDLIAFRNGVFDLEANAFRSAERDDYIVLSTKYDYIAEETIRMNPEEYAKYLRARRMVERLLRQVYPDASLRKYVRRFHSSLLTGRCPNEYIHFFTGVNSSQTGANGKSTIDLLLLTVMGEYATVGHPSLLTGAREAAGGTNSAMVALRWRRYVSFQEVNDNGKGTVTLNMQVIKGLTGGDPQTARELYEKQATPFLPTWKVSVSANKLPPMNSDEGGARRRVRDIPHVAKFVPADEINNPEWESLRKQKLLHKMDPTIKEEIRDNPYVRLAYMHILLAEHVHFRKGSSKGELTKCRAVIDHTSKYLKAQDVWRTWMEEILEQVEVALPVTPSASAVDMDVAADPDVAAGAEGEEPEDDDDVSSVVSDDDDEGAADPEEGAEPEEVSPTPLTKTVSIDTAKTILLQSDLVYIFARQRRQIMSYGLTVRREDFILELSNPTRLGIPLKPCVYEVTPTGQRLEITEPHWLGWKVTDPTLRDEIAIHRKRND